MNDKLRDTIQDCNLNFLIGSGLSCPYLKTLGNIEVLLTALDSSSSPEATKSVLRASIYKRYFDIAIGPNIEIIEDHADAKPTHDQYRAFLQVLNDILLRRKSTILSKQSNIFTTNIDIFLEKSLEDVGLEYNDGFSGRFNPFFDLSNFKKSHFKKSLHYDNTSEIPVFNLLKLHGSLSWRLSTEASIEFSRDLALVRSAKSKILPADQIVEVAPDSTLATLTLAADGMTPTAAIAEFMAEFEKIPIVNPTKLKFRDTLMNQTYYEMLRIYANELEKENTVLFVLGFSFADEHIREITLRAANSNPTLMIYVVAYDTAAGEEIGTRFKKGNVKNQNIEIITPPAKEGVSPREDAYRHDLATINEKVFGSIVETGGVLPVVSPGATGAATPVT
jgi:hypothetical protein